MNRLKALLHALAWGVIYGTVIRPLGLGGDVEEAVAQAVREAAA